METSVDTNSLIQRALKTKGGIHRVRQDIPPSDTPRLAAMVHDQTRLIDIAQKVFAEEALTVEEAKQYEGNRVALRFWDPPAHNFLGHVTDQIWRRAVQSAIKGFVENHKASQTNGVWRLKSAAMAAMETCPACEGKGCQKCADGQIPICKVYTKKLNVVIEERSGNVSYDEVETEVPHFMIALEIIDTRGQSDLSYVNGRQAATSGAGANAEMLKALLGEFREAHAASGERDSLTAKVASLEDLVRQQAAMVAQLMEGRAPKKA